MPSEYQQVEYIQSSGAQYINPGIYNSEPIYEFYIHLLITGIVNNSNYIFGTWNPEGRCTISYSPTTFGLGYADKNTGGTSAPIINTRYELSGTLKPGTQTLYINGALALQTTTNKTPTPKRTFFIFADNNGGATDFARYRLYRLFYIGENNSYIGDYYPCYRKSDNKPGLYDLVTQAFFTNEGTGDFTTGNII